eukprot:5828-Heterococcus_DN1.PRE.2
MRSLLRVRYEQTVPRANIAEDDLQKTKTEQRIATFRCSEQEVERAIHHIVQQRTREKKTLSQGSAVTTAARLHYAVDNNMDMKEVDVYVFAEIVAVKHNKLQLLQSLPRRDFDSTVLITEAARSAAKHDCVAVLSWLHSVTAAAIWTDKLMRELFFDAGRWASFDSLEWLREQGNHCSFVMSAKLLVAALMPRWLCMASKFPSCTSFYKDYLFECWPVPAIQWALDNGSGWRDWQCSQLAPEHYYCIQKNYRHSNAEHNDDECQLKCARKR